MSLDRESETLDATSGEPLLPGDRLRTGSGLVEIWFPDGSDRRPGRLHDRRTRLPFAHPTDRRPSDPGGRAQARNRRRRPAIRSTRRGARPSPAGPGEYRVSLTAGSREGSVELAVVRGAAQLTSDGGSISVRSGERAFARADARAEPSRSLQRRAHGHLWPLGGEPVETNDSAAPRRHATCRPTCRCTAAPSIATARGKPMRPTATSGTRRSTPAGVPTTTATGRRCGPTA